MAVHLLGVLSLDLHILFKCIFLYSEYIQVIMSMEESVQHVVMMAIQEVCSTVFAASTFSPLDLDMLRRLFLLLLFYSF